MNNTEKLKIGLIEQDNNIAKKIESSFKKQQNEVELVRIFKIENDIEKLKQELKEEGINTLVINIFYYPDGVNIIDSIKGKPVPVCILGTKEQFTEFKGFSESSRERFRSYCNLKTDDNDLEIRIADMSRQLLYCKRTKTKKIEFQKQISDKLDDNTKKIYEDILKYEREIKKHRLENFENNIKPKVEQEVKKEIGKFILGLDVDELNILINRTLNETSRTIRQYKIINIIIIAVGIILVLGTAIYSVVPHASAQGMVRYDILAFGGVGLAGIIASLITNPTSSINKTIRQKIQIQIAYFGFLKQIEILNKVRKDDRIRKDDEIDMGIAIEQSECLEKTTRSLQETLSKYFDE